MEKKHKQKKVPVLSLAQHFLWQPLQLVLDFLHRPDSSQETSKEALAS